MARLALHLLYVITKLLRAAVPVAALAMLPLTASTPASADEALPLVDAVDAMPLHVESRDGYQRTSFKHWNAGANPTDGCNTRQEVLIAEAVTAPTVGPNCAITGGEWRSYYDDTTVTDARSLDIDHMVPLAEAWDSGASAWTPARREAYANDLGADTSLIGVTARSNRSKADKDPAQWLPPAADARCRYVGEWVGTKLRWGLTIDESEQAALRGLAAECPDTVVTYEPAS